MAKILIAGEDAVATEILSAEILAEGYEVLLVPDGYQAVEQTLERKPELVFVEPSLPIFSGYEVCSMLRKDPDVPAGLPIVFIVSLDADLRRIEKVGATACLAKLHAAWELRDLLAKYVPGS